MSTKFSLHVSLFQIYRYCCRNIILSIYFIFIVVNPGGIILRWIEHVERMEKNRGVEKYREIEIEVCRGGGGGGGRGRGIL